MTHLLCRLFGHKWIPNYCDGEDGPEWFCHRCPVEKWLDLKTKKYFVKETL